MNCKCGTNDAEAGWSGITRVHPQPRGQIENGIFGEVHLNSYRKEGDVHLYSISVGCMEIANDLPVAHSISSFYAEDDQIFGADPRELRISREDLGINPKITAQIVMAEDIEVLTESDEGMSAEIESIELLKITAEFSALGEKIVTDSLHPYLLGCFIIQRKCIHDKCGPSWFRYNCNYRCVSRVCGNYGKCTTKFYKNGKTCYILPCT